MTKQIMNDTASAAQQVDRSVLELTEVGKTYGSGRDAVEAIRSVSFDVRAGEMIAIVGPSGAGKTTLLNCIVGLLPTTAGGVLFEGQNVKEIGRASCRERGCKYV